MSSYRLFGKVTYGEACLAWPGIQATFVERWCMHIKPCALQSSLALHVLLASAGCSVAV